MRAIPAEIGPHRFRGSRCGSRVRQHPLKPVEGVERYRLWCGVYLQGGLRNEP